MENKSALRVGLIGCGYQGQWLARAAGALDAFRLAACTDPNGVATAAVASIVDGVEVEESSETLIARQDVDVVFIATPHHLLQPFALQAVTAGKHVLAEKPIALNADQATELEAAVAERGVTYMAGYSFRYLDPVAEAKRLTSEGVIGEIKTISAGMTRPGVRSTWVADPESGGGILGFYGSHLIDRVLWLVDDKPVEVSASVTYHPDYGVDQTSLFQVRFSRGAVAQFNICGEAAGWFDFAHFCGSEGHLYLAMAEIPNYSLTVTSRVNEQYSRPVTRETALDRPTAVEQKMKAELQDFAQAVRQQRQPPITVSDGRKVLEIMDAVRLSDQKGKPVSLA